MKSITKIITLLIIGVLAISSCSTDDSNNQTPEEQQQNAIANRTSTTCEGGNENVTGYTGLYWDMSNGDNLAFTELPGLPVVQNPGGQFIHTQQPSLAFTLPQGFSAFESAGQTVLGADVIRDDNQVVYRWVPLATVFEPLVPTQTVIAQEINNVLEFYGFEGQPEVLCTNTIQDTSIIPREFTGRLIRFNGIIAQVWVIGTYVDGLGSTSFTLSVSAAPEAEYETQVQQTFLPFIFQLYVRPEGGFVDNDMDGFDVLVDPDDNNPNVP